MHTTPNFSKRDIAVAVESWWFVAPRAGDWVCMLGVYYLIHWQGPVSGLASVVLYRGTKEVDQVVPMDGILARRLHIGLV